MRCQGLVLGLSCVTVFFFSSSRQSVTVSKTIPLLRSCSKVYVSDFQSTHGCVLASCCDSEDQKSFHFSDQQALIIRQNEETVIFLWTPSKSYFIKPSSVQKKKSVQIGSAYLLRGWHLEKRFIFDVYSAFHQRLWALWSVYELLCFSTCESALTCRLEFFSLYITYQ